MIISAFSICRSIHKPQPVSDVTYNITIFFKETFCHISQCFGLDLKTLWHACHAPWISKVHLVYRWHDHKQITYHFYNCWCVLHLAASWVAPKGSTYKKSQSHFSHVKAGKKKKKKKHKKRGKKKGHSSQLCSFLCSFNCSDKESLQETWS